MYLSIFCTICCLMDEVSFGLRCKKSWHAACWRLQSGAGVRKRSRCQFCMAGSRGSSLSSGCRNLFTLRLADSRVAVQLSQLCRPLPDISGVTVLPPSVHTKHTKDWTTARTLWLRWLTVCVIPVGLQPGIKEDFPANLNASSCNKDVPALLLMVL